MQTDQRVVLDILGTRVAVTGPAAMLDRVRTQWSRCRPETPDPADPDHEIALADWLDPVTRERDLTSGLTLLGLQHLAGRINLHAAGIADPISGATVVLVAPSGTGKTTAARRLGRSFGYVSDECISVDPVTLAVLPYPKPLAVLPADGSAKHTVSPDELGLGHAPDVLHLDAIVLLERDPDAVAALEPLSTPEAIRHLVTQTSALGAVPAPLATLATLINRVGGAQVLRYAEIDDAVDLLRPGRSRTRSTWTFDHLGAGPAPTDAPQAFDEAQQGWRATPWRDAVADQDVTVVMIQQTCYRLAGTTAQTWARIAGIGDRARPSESIRSQDLADLAAHGLISPA